MIVNFPILTKNPQKISKNGKFDRSNIHRNTFQNFTNIKLKVNYFILTFVFFIRDLLFMTFEMALILSHTPVII